MNPEPGKILVIRLSSIGDILLTTPLLRLLKRRFPQAEIGFVIKKQFIDLIRTNKNVDRIFSFDASAGFGDLRRIKREVRDIGYDLVIDIHKNFRSYYLQSGLPKSKIVSYSKYRLQRFLLIKLGWDYRQVIPVYQRYLMSVAEFGIQDDGAGLDFFLDPDVKQRVDELLSRKNLQVERPIIGLAPGAGFATKRWLPEHYAAVARRMVAERNAQVLLFGSQADSPITREIAGLIGPHVFDVSGQFSLMETACALARCDLLITNDTGLMHLATALHVKTVAIFGPTTKELGFFPVGEMTRVAEHEKLSCRPCTHMGSKRCPKGHFRCMRELLPDRVYDFATELLDGPSDSRGKKQG